MDKQQIIDKLIDSYSIAHFALGHKIYDKEKERPKAIENAITIVETQITMLKNNIDIFLIHGAEISDLDFWKNIKRELNEL